MIKKIIYEYLLKEKIISAEDNCEEIAIKLHDFSNYKEIVISGNRLGLIELADFILDVALSDVKGCHTHLDELNFFDTANVELVIEHIGEIPPNKEI